MCPLGATVLIGAKVPWVALLFPRPPLRPQRGMGWAPEGSLGLLGLPGALGIFLPSSWNKCSGCKRPLWGNKGRLWGPYKTYEILGAPA